MLSAGPAVSTSTPEAEAFVRFCYQRRRVGWPELYDEMCLVATRGLYQGMGHEALAEIGVGFSLFETPRLAQLVIRVATEEQAARRAARATCPTIAPAQLPGDARTPQALEVARPATDVGAVERAPVQVATV
ncbi:MAG: hypothetical protein ABIR11_10975 [Candidatus Limnocylindrales bacterium]